MKYLIAAILSFAMITSTIPTAKADNSEEVIIGVLGGALGGLIIGSAINGNGNRERVIVREQYIYEEVEPECYTRVVRVWDPNRDRYVKVRKTVCN
jgi:hypothetical protein